MTGVLAQLVSLTSYGNQCIGSGQFPLYYYPQHSTFKFCNKVDFLQLRDGQETVLCPNPNSWFGYLKLSACQKLRLYYQPAAKREGAMEHQLAGMIGGNGVWLIETIYEGSSNYWSNRWLVTQKEDTEKKIWSVDHALTHVQQPTNDLQYDLAETSADLSIVLSDIAAFARQHKMSNWAKIFEKALARLTSDDPVGDYYHHDLIVGENYSLQARQLLFGAASAWVFGGMGSWNDEGFNDAGDQQSYEILSARLYGAVNRSIVAATNSF
jgi:hypothetical protein